MRRVLSALSFVALLGCSVIGCGKQGVGERCDLKNTPAGGLGGDCEDNLKCSGTVCCEPTDLACLSSVSDAGTTDGATDTGLGDTGATDTGATETSTDTGTATDAADASETATDAASEAATEAGTDAADGG